MKRNCTIVVLWILSALAGGCLTTEALEWAASAGVGKDIDRSWGMPRPLGPCPYWDCPRPPDF